MAERLDLKVHIIAPSSYYPDGTLKQYYKTLMYPPAFNVLSAIIEQAGEEQNRSFSTAFYDERVQKGDGYFKPIIEDKSAEHKAVVLTAKTHEIPRATDIAREMIAFGIPTIIGGPGVTLADWETLDAFNRMKLRFGVGEGENIVKKMADDLVTGQLKDGYYQKGLVDMRKAPKLKMFSKEQLASSISGLQGCDSNRGCPFHCKFCAAIIISGRLTGITRSRKQQDVEGFVEEASRDGIPVMESGDNCRFSYLYKKTSYLSNLGDLNARRREEKKRVFIFGQMDVEEDVIDDAEAFGKAGFAWTFRGLESTDPLVLAAEGKKQNHPDFYQTVIDAYHAQGILESTGYMIGFAPQTEASIAAEDLKFRDLPDIAYPFIVTPLPRTPDYIEAVREGQITDCDLNKYDTTYSVRGNLERMTQEEVEGAYRRSFINLYMGRPAEKGSFLSYAQMLVKHGLEKKGVPFHLMMDGLIRPNLPVVHRPADGFRGPVFDKDDPAFASIEAFEAKREAWLLENCWVTSES